MGTAVKIILVANPSDAEARCICQVAKMYFQRDQRAAMALDHQALLDGQVPEISPDATHVVIVLTRGALEKPAFADVVSYMFQKTNLNFVPIVADQGFVFPDKFFWDVMGAGRKCEGLKECYQHMFFELIVKRFSAHASEAVQLTEI